MRHLTSKRLKTHSIGCLAGYSLLFAVCLFSSRIAKAQQVIATAVSSGPNVIAMTTYQGNIYYATATPGAIYKMTPSGMITLIAGAIGGGSTVNTIINHPPATTVSIAPGVNGLAFDAAGNLYFTEPANHQIREIVAPVDAPGAVVLTFDNLQLNYPGAMVQSNGVLYVADESLHIVISENISNGIRKVIAGFWDASNPFPPGGYSGDGGPGNQAKLNHPRGLAFDAAGNLYIADTGNNAIRRVDTAGTITTVAGTGVAGFAGDGGAASAAQLFLPGGVAIDASGNLLIADTSNNRVRVVTAAGTISTLAGNGAAAFSGDGGTAVNASLAFPAALTFDVAGNLYIADSQNNRVRALTGGNISTIAGSSQPKYAGDGVANGNYLNQPSYVAFDTAGNLFFSDTQNSRVRRLDVVSHEISTVVGNGVPGSDGMGGPATNARIGCPEGLAFGNNGSLLIADPCAMLVFKVAPSADRLVKGRSDETISIFAGGGTFDPSSGQTSSATEITVGTVLAVAVEKDTDTVVIGSVPVGYNGGYVLAVSPVNGAFTIRQGQGTVADCLAAGGGDNTLFGSSDSDNDPVTYASAALRGQQFVSWFDLGISSGNVSEFIGGLAFDKFGNLYASASETTDTVFEITSTRVLVLAGNRLQGYSGDGGDPTLAQLNQPLGVGVDPAGNIFVADTGNNVIREVGALTTQSPPGVPSLLSTPENLTKQKSATFTFTDTDPTITSYSCVLDGVTQACASGVSYSNLADGSHTFGVSAMRADGTASVAATFTWVVDTTPPPVPTIDSHPANPSPSANNNFGFSDAEAGVRFTCSLDGAATDCSSPVFYSNLADGPHTFSVSASDALQNQSAANTFTWTIRTTAPPAPTITTGPAALSNVTAPTFVFSDSLVGVTFICQVNNAAATPCASPYTGQFSSLIQGPNVFSVIAIDPVSGRSSTATTYNWTVDSVGPLVQITDAPGTLVFPRVSNFNFGAVGGDAVQYLCSLDGAGFTPCAPPLSLQVYGIGRHNFQVEAVDALGNVGEVTSYGWNITACTCDISGAYASPAFGNPINNAVSPDQEFSVSARALEPTDQVSLMITSASTGKVVYNSVQSFAGWRFSPDSKRFMYLLRSSGVNQTTVGIVDLTPDSSRLIFNNTYSQTDIDLSFSPQGNYFHVGLLLNQSQFHLEIYRVANVSMATKVYQDEFTFQQGAGDPESTFGVAAWGFNSGGPETAFAYAYSTGVNTAQVNAVNLATGKRTVNTQFTGISGFWQFNPCGNRFVVVSQTSPNELNVQLFNVDTGAVIPVSESSFPLDSLKFATESPNEDVIGTGFDKVLAVNPSCSPNTTPGNNQTVSLRNTSSSTNPATVTFSDVTGAGQTGVTSSNTGAAPPAQFSVGTPPVFYDIATTASYSGDITVCFSYAGVMFQGQPALFHFVNGAWVNVTTSVDPTTQTICGTVTSLSPFAVFSSGADQPPTAQAGANQVVEATSSAGAGVTLSGVGSDPDNDPLTFTWSEGAVILGNAAQISTTLPIGLHNITLTTDDGRGGTGASNVFITIQDTTPPALTLPSNQTLEATGPTGAVANFTASATDIVDGTRPVVCAPASGSTFAIGTTTASCSSSDTHGNSSSGSFTIVVRDTTPPILSAPTNRTLTATSSSGAVAVFAASATDIVDGAVPVICTPASGSAFPIGTTTVKCTSIDAHGNSSAASFTITVISGDTQPPVVTPPASITIPATEAGGARGSAWPALAAFLAGATAKDNIDPSPVPLPPQFGNASVNNNTLFPYGTTTVTFEFRDASGNVGSATAMVNVILGTVKLSANVAGQGKNADGTSFVDLTVSNVGTGNARKLRVDFVAALPTRGNGIVKVVSPAFPMTIGIGNLDSGASQTIRIVLKVPASVKQFQLVEVGAFANVKGSPDIFAFVQTLTP
ncbi:MAG: HYR domain-containing protein [Candidatus Acidiferrum sp.]